jgi:uncharacterized protein (UPF0332 family)
MEPFESYLSSGKVSKRTPDPVEASSLLRKAQLRLAYVSERKITDENAQFVLEDAYEASREAAQALMSVAGYKPYSHEATISFIKRFHANSFRGSEIAAFDHFRELRNMSVYRAVHVTKEEAYECVAFAKSFIEKSGRILG